MKLPQFSIISEDQKCFCSEEQMFPKLQKNNMFTTLHKKKESLLFSKINFKTLPCSQLCKKKTEISNVHSFTKKSAKRSVPPKKVCETFNSNSNVYILTFVFSTKIVMCIKLLHTSFIKLLVNELTENLFRVMRYRALLPENQPRNAWIGTKSASLRW